MNLKARATRAQFKAHLIKVHQRSKKIRTGAMFKVHSISKKIRIFPCEGVPGRFLPCRWPSNLRRRCAAPSSSSPARPRPRGGRSWPRPYFRARRPPSRAGGRRRCLRSRCCLRISVSHFLKVFTIFCQILAKSSQMFASDIAFFLSLIHI